MIFKEPKTKIIEEFTKNKFIEIANKGLEHTNTHPVYDCIATNTKIILSYPGNKAGWKGKYYSYDFRVDSIIRGMKLALSHANIIVDIYNKVKYGGMDAEMLMAFLIFAMEEGEFDLPTAIANLPYSPINPSVELLEIGRVAHGGKRFDERCNSVDLTLEELFVSILYIGMQEDVNYPIEHHKKGRIMPLERYLEAIHVCVDDSHTLTEVIERALAHGIPPEQWKDLNYGILRSQML